MRRWGVVGASIASVVMAAMEVPAGGAMPRRQPVSCCLPVHVPGVTEAARCTVVHLNIRPRRLRAKRRAVCRLLGGNPVVDGGCRCPESET